MRINHNIAALNTYRQLTNNTNSTSKSLEKLSSGLRINRAGDDAAGLAISEKMRSQIRGLDTASKNASDGISLIQTAEGALNETHSILQRMKELAVQSANDTNTNEDRAEMQKEIDQLTEEISRIAKQTEFNTKKLLDGSMSSVASETTSTLSAAGITVSVAAGTPPASGVNYSVEVIKTSGAATPASPAVGSLVTTGINGGTATFTAANVSTDIATGEYVFEYTKNTDSFTLAVDGGAATAFNPANFADYGIVADMTGVAADNTGTFTLTITAAAQAAVPAGEASVAVKVMDGTTDVTSKFEVKFGDTLATGTHTGTITVDNDQASIFHIGANQGQNTSLVINNMDAASLGVDAVKLTEQSLADAAITTIDNAINQVSSQRAALGAMQNRLEHTINNLGTASENLTAAEARIRDVDMAKEMMEFTKNNILSQASQAMLAQANMQPQGVLQLLQ